LITLCTRAPISQPSAHVLPAAARFVEPAEYRLISQSDGYLRRIL
jgi:hypothetical protein